MPSADDVFDKLDMSAFVISCIACLYMFYCYYKLPCKNFGAQMIITLIIADFIYHFTTIASAFEFMNIESLQYISEFISLTAFGFSVFWSSFLALFIYKLISQNVIELQTSKYYRSSFLIALSLPIILSLILCYYDDRDIDAPNVVSDSLQETAKLINGFYVIALLPTPFFYIKSIRFLKQNGFFSTKATQQFISTLYRYAFIQFIALGPSTLYIEYWMITGNDYPYVRYTTMIFRGLIGFSHCMVYFFTRDGFGTSAEKKIRNSIATTSESFYQGLDREEISQIKIHAYT